MTAWTWSPCWPTSTRTASSVLQWMRSERDLESGLHAQQSAARKWSGSPFAGSRDVGRSERLLRVLDGGGPSARRVGIRATSRRTRDDGAVLGLEGRRDAPWLPATSSFASCGKRSRAERQPDQRRGSSFPTGRSKTTSFLSSRCTPFVTFCNFKCSDCVNHVRFFPQNAEKFSGLGNVFTKHFISESHLGRRTPRRQIVSEPESRCFRRFPWRHRFVFRYCGARPHRCRISSKSAAGVVENELTLGRGSDPRIVLMGLCASGLTRER